MTSRSGSTPSAASTSQSCRGGWPAGSLSFPTSSRCGGKARAGRTTCCLCWARWPSSTKPAGRSRRQHMRKSESMSEPTEPPFSPGVGAIFEVVARLRAPGGCPWDREQTHESLRPYLLEETYELLEAIDSGDDAKIKEELGDLLLQVAMHAEIAAEEGRFDAQKISEAVAAKMVKRH